MEETCVTCGGLHPYSECLATDSNTFNASAATRTYNQGVNEYRPQGDPNYRCMRTRSSSNLIVEFFTLSKRRNHRRSKQRVEPELRTIVETLVANMADTRTMPELLQAPTEGYRDAIIIPAILAENFELKVGLLSLVTSSQFHGFERDDPHSHIRWFNKITSTLKYKNVPHDAIKLMFFPFSLEGAARTWLEKEPSCSIHTWEDLVSKFVNYFFPHAKTTNLKNDITNFQLKFDETFSEAWDRFKDLLPAGGNLLNRTPRDVLTIIENKSKVRTSRNKPVVSKVNTTTSSSSPYLDITALTDFVKELVLMNKANQQASVKAIEETCVTCGGPHPCYECIATDSNTFNASAATGTYIQGEQSTSRKLSRSEQSRIQSRKREKFQSRKQQLSSSKLSSSIGPSNELTNYMKSNEATLRALQTQMTNMKTELRNEFKSTIDTKTNKIENQNNQKMNILTNLTMQKQSPSGSGSLPSNTIANPRGDVKAITTQSGVAYEGPSIPPTSSSPEGSGTRIRGDKGQGLESCMALADLGATINLMPLSVWKKLSLPYLTPTRMTLELATRSFAYPAGIAEDVFVQVGNFTFPTDFVVIDYDVDLRVPLILGRHFLRTARALVNKSNHPSSGSTTPLSDSSPSLTPFETSDSLLEEFVDELALLDPFPPGNEDDNFDFEADIRKIKYLLNQDPSTEFDVEIIDPILEKFTDEPAIDYSPPPEDDDDDLFDLKSDNDEWKKLLYGDCYKDTGSEKDKNKDYKMKSLVVEAHIVESNDLLP
uniref:Reverse transcriptase domain-containing protein n=1 Tax=Tanacetum cinerariifolium TaxID=118510 RepID=A0A6L2NWZ1_TANCI|nr:reverse transcriptase domain-containing protein [Tanacetum cinerariifolium]